MTIQQQVESELTRWGGEPTQLTIDTEVGQVAAQIQDLDRIGCTFSSLAVRSDRLAGATPDQMRQVGDDLAGRLSYLMEPISPIEIDREGAVVQLRSQPPQQDDDGATYFELLVRRDGLTLERYQKAVGAVRQKVPAQVTRVILGRLADDMVGALAEV